MRSTVNRAARSRARRASDSRFAGSAISFCRQRGACPDRPARRTPPRRPSFRAGWGCPRAPARIRCRGLRAPTGRTARTVPGARRSTLADTTHASRRSRVDRDERTPGGNGFDESLAPRSRHSHRPRHIDGHVAQCPMFLASSHTRPAAKMRSDFTSGAGPWRLRPFGITRTSGHGAYSWCRAARMASLGATTSVAAESPVETSSEYRSDAAGAGVRRTARHHDCTHE